MEYIVKVAGWGKVKVPWRCRRGWHSLVLVANKKTGFQYCSLCGKRSPTNPVQIMQDGEIILVGHGDWYFDPENTEKIYTRDIDTDKLGETIHVRDLVGEGEVT